jgi:hypothetical protein
MKGPIGKWAGKSQQRNLMRCRPGEWAREILVGCPESDKEKEVGPALDVGQRKDEQEFLSQERAVLDLPLECHNAHFLLSSTRELEALH